MIGDDVVVQVLSVERDQVRIGISAPRRIPIHREEVYRSIVAQNQAASRSSSLPEDLITRFNK